MPATPHPAEPSGTIESPSPRDPVLRAFTVEGSLSAIPRDRQIWVAVQIGNLLFPKESSIPAGDQHFVQDIVEGGEPPGGRFSLALLMVDSVGEGAD